MFGKILEIKVVKFAWPVIVAEITDPVIIGLDFLSTNKALTDLSEQSINIQGMEIKAEVRKADENAVNVARVLLQKKLRIPPHTEVQIVGKLDTSIGGNVMIQPSQSIKGLLSPYSITTQANKLLCKRTVLNLS